MIARVPQKLNLACRRETTNAWQRGRSERERRQSRKGRSGNFIVQSIL